MADGLPLTGWIVAVHLAATGMMIGVIWFVQVVHYPLMAMVGRDATPRTRRRTSAARAPW